MHTEHSSTFGTALYFEAFMNITSAILTFRVTSCSI